MAVLKCKMCGGELNITDTEIKVIECEYCGTTQTLPSLDNEKKLNLFARANRLRAANEFDKAAGVFESIVAEFPAEAEAYWGLCLCKYGIEYVDDPATGKKIPTCHRTAYESIFEDSDFEQALENADVVAQRVYRAEAKEIDRLQKAILDVVKNEQPFDVFICYKETAEDGQRTQDSVIAQDVYDALTEKGLKVFFSRITLEDKLGQEYEPYIFSALNSARVMLAFGTSYEYYNAVWVKNEWSRFLSMMQKDKKKVLIPCYKDIDAYDMPAEFKNLQAQDMSKVGAIQDLVRGIGKILRPEPEKTVIKETVVQRTSGINVENLLKRGYLCLEDKKWDEAVKYFNDVLNENVEDYRAYIGLLCAEKKIKNEKELVSVESFTGSEYYKKACRFGGKEVEDRLNTYYKQFKYNEAAKLFSQAITSEQFEKVKILFDDLGSFLDSPQKSKECGEKAIRVQYITALSVIRTACQESQYLKAIDILEKIRNYKNSANLIDECLLKINNIKERIYNKACELSESEDKSKLKEAIDEFKRIGDYKDSKKKIRECEEKISEITERQRKERERLQREEARAKRKKIIIIISSFSAVLACAVFYFAVILPYIIPSRRYHEAASLYQQGRYSEAADIFNELGSWSDSAIQYQNATNDQNYSYAVSLFNHEKYEDAKEKFESLGSWKDSAQQVINCDNAVTERDYNTAVALFNEEKYEEAQEIFESLGNWSDSARQVEKCGNAIKKREYRAAAEKFRNEEYEEALKLFKALGDFSDSSQQAEKCSVAINERDYNTAVSLFNEEKYEEAIDLFNKLGDYSASKEYESKCKDSIYKVAINYYNNREYEKAVLAFRRLGDYNYDQTYKINALLASNKTGEAKQIINKLKIEKIVLPDGMTSIRQGMLEECTSLKSVIIPNSVTSIGKSAFSNCKNLIQVNIPSGVKSIGEYAFYKCTNLQSITIPDGVTSIGDDAFNKCTNLQSITIPDGVTSIGDSAFWDCLKLSSVSIPSSVKEIGWSAFGSCDSLASITIPKNCVTDHSFSYNTEVKYK